MFIFRNVSEKLEDVMAEIDEMAERVHEAMEMFVNDEEDLDVDDLEKELGIGGYAPEPVQVQPELPSVPTTAVPTSQTADLDAMLAELEI